MRTWLAVLLLAACGHGAAKPTTPVAANGASCDQVSSHVIQLMPGNKNDDSTADIAKKLATVLTDRCTQDAWSAQARQCLVDAKEMKDTDACQSTLTKAQLDAFGKAIEAAMPAPTADKTPVTEAAPPPPPPAPAADAPPAKTRGAQKKASKPGGKAGKTGDPCEGGE